MCEAVGWVLAASYEYWPTGRPDTNWPEVKSTAIADYLHVGTPQPASIFFDVREGWFTENNPRVAFNNCLRRGVQGVLACLKAAGVEIH